MRIAIHAINSPSDYSGGRFAAWMMAEALAERGHEVVLRTTCRPVFCRDFAAYPAHDTIRVVTDGGGPWRKAPEPCDLVIVVPHATRDMLFYRRALLHARRAGAKLALLNFESANWFNSLSPEPRDPCLWNGWRYIATRASLVLSTAQEGTRFAREFYDNANETAFDHCLLGLNSRVTDSVPPMPREKRIVLITRLTKGNGHKGGNRLDDILCEAMRGYTLVLIVGVGTLSETHADGLQRLADAHGVRLEFLYRLSEREKFIELKRSALVLFPSLFEGYGLPPVEAQYCNTPCVAFDLPVLREVSGDAIIYAERGNWEDFRRKVTETLQSNRAWDHLHNQIAPVAKFEHYAARVDEVFREAISRPMPAALTSTSVWQLQLAIGLDLTREWWLKRKMVRMRVIRMQAIRMQVARMRDFRARDFRVMCSGVICKTLRLALGLRRYEQIRLHWRNLRARGMQL